MEDENEEKRGHHELSHKVDKFKQEEEEDIDAKAFDDNFNSLLASEEPEVLVISDTHVGAIGSHATLLDNVLTSIENSLESGNSKIQGLLIIGDFFDYICQDASALESIPEVQNVFSKVDKLANRIKVKVTLGNHEIPIAYGLEAKTYNFGKHRDAFVNMLKEHANGQFETFLDPSNFCQWVSISNEGGDTITITGHDDINELKGASCDGKILLSHGYQFFPKENDVYGVVWKNLMHNPEEAKEVIDIMYNAKHVDPADEMDDVKEAVGKPGHRFERLVWEELVEHVKKHQNWVKQREENNKAEAYRQKEIEKFLQKNNLEGLSNVIYGHTHKAEHLTIPFGSNTVEVYNTGTWQHLPPTMIGIKLKEGQFAISAKIWDKESTSFAPIQ
jgi:UDP-2,3-diacylglucosamine pyrophosphatase LpxH